MAKKRKKRSYRQACERDIENDNASKFTCACRRRFPDLSAKHPAKKPCKKS